MFELDIVTNYLNEIGPYLMPTFVLIYLQVASMSCSSSFSLPNLLDLPNQPTDYNFSRREFGKSKITCTVDH